MAVRQTGVFRRSAEYSRVIDALYGLNDADDPTRVHAGECADMENIFRDYAGKNPSALVTAPGFRKYMKFEDPVHAVFPCPTDSGEKIGVHAGTKLYVVDRPEDLSEGTPPEAALSTLADRKSRAFVFGGDSYLLDGTNYIRIHNGVPAAVDTEAYIPTVGLNGEAYEQRNLLTTAAKERYTLGSSAEYAVCSNGLRYAVENGKAVVTGIDNPNTLSVTVPAEARVNGQVYEVTAIGEYAFDGAGFRSVSLPEGLLKIGNHAFRSCHRLTSVRIPDTVTEIEEFAFYHCDALTEIYFGGSLTRCEAGAFGGCTAVTTVKYALAAADFAEITDISYAGDLPGSLSELLEQADTVVYNAVSSGKAGGEYLFPLSRGFRSVSRVTLNGSVLSSSATPIFPTESNLLFTKEAIYSALNHNYFWGMAIMTPERDGSFSVVGYPERTFDYAFLSAHPPAGRYRLTGKPERAPAWLYCEVGGTKYRDNGAGVVFSVSEGQEVKLGIECDDIEACFFGERYLPVVEMAGGYVTYTPVYEQKDGAPAVTKIRLTTDNAAVLLRSELEVTGALPPRDKSFAAMTGYTGDLSSAVYGCTGVTHYDGRAFFWGNPALPHTVFHISRRADGELDATYVGDGSYFVDGRAAAPETAVLTAGDALAVLRSEAGGESTIYLHKGADSDSRQTPRIYPVTATGTGLPVGSGFPPLAGDALFYSGGRLYTVTVKDGIPGVTEVGQRIFARLAARNADVLSSVIHDGFLWFTFGDGECFLADLRLRDGDGYCFYRLSGVGSYTDDTATAVYEKSVPPDAPEDFRALPEKDGEKATLPVSLSSGFPYVTENGEKIAVRFTGERTGGTFSPAGCFLSYGGRLYFGTADGTLAIYNGDMRKPDKTFPREAYRHIGHRYPSRIELCADACDAPYTAKNLIPYSAVAELSDHTGGELSVSVRGEPTERYRETDRVYGGESDFGAVDFSEWSYGNKTLRALPLSSGMRQRSMIQFRFDMTDFEGRFGLSGLSFRYKTGGKIKV